ncbi:MAG TPA: hypothetical protein VFL29_09935 [Candidatus Dormibacteraeota bacterium]|nr:hypothetical protein [Candidatus Dormibacteraeota bacterium]
MLARIVAATLAVMVIAACGSSTTTTASVVSPSPSPIPSLKTSPAPRTCPTAARVNAALGTNVRTPVSVVGAGSTQLPAGASGQSCEYPGTSENVIIIIVTNIDPSNISKFSDRFPAPYTSVSGVGDQARAFKVQLGGGKDNEGVVATKGTTIIALTATATPASLAQIEALINQLF